MWKSENNFEKRKQIGFIFGFYYNRMAFLKYYTFVLNLKFLNRSRIIQLMNHRVQK